MDCPAKVKGEHPKTLSQMNVIIHEITPLPHGPPSLSPARGRGVPVHGAKPPRLPVIETGGAAVLWETPQALQSLSAAES